LHSSFPKALHPLVSSPAFNTLNSNYLFARFIYSLAVAAVGSHSPVFLAYFQIQTDFAAPSSIPPHDSRIELISAAAILFRNPFSPALLPRKLFLHAINPFQSLSASFQSTLTCKCLSPIAMLTLFHDLIPARPLILLFNHHSLIIILWPLFILL